MKTKSRENYFRPKNKSSFYYLLTRESKENYFAIRFHPFFLLLLASLLLFSVTKINISYKVSYLKEKKTTHKIILLLFLFLFLLPHNIYGVIQKQNFHSIIEKKNR